MMLDCTAFETMHVLLVQPFVNRFPNVRATKNSSLSQDELPISPQVTFPKLFSFFALVQRQPIHSIFYGRYTSRHKLTIVKPRFRIPFVLLIHSSRSPHPHLEPRAYKHSDPATLHHASQKKNRSLARYHPKTRTSKYYRARRPHV